jgi:hypothetical protein
MGKSQQIGRSATAIANHNGHFGNAKKINIKLKD